MLQLTSNHLKLWQQVGLSLKVKKLLQRLANLEEMSRMEEAYAVQAEMQGDDVAAKEHWKTHRKALDSLELLKVQLEDAGYDGPLSSLE